MNLRKLVGIDSGIQELQFELKPLALNFQKSMDHSYVLYLFKGMQVLGRFATQQQDYASKQYRFKFNETSVFRMGKISKAKYSWHLYRISPQNGQQQFIHSTKINLKTAVQMYQIQLAQKQRQLQNNLKNKDSTALHQTVIVQIWRIVRSKLQKRKESQLCFFSNKAISLEYQFEIKNSLDLYMEKNPVKSMRNSTNRNIVKIDSKQQEVDQNLLKIKIGGQTAQKQYETLFTKENITYRPPQKKFSLLSDIIQMSYEGSTVYGGPELGVKKISQDIQSLGKAATFHQQQLDTIKRLNKFNTIQVDDKHLNYNFINKSKTLFDSHGHKGKKEQNSPNILMDVKVHDISHPFTATTAGEQQYDSCSEIFFKDGRQVPEAVLVDKDNKIKWILVVALLIFVAVLGIQWYQFNQQEEISSKMKKNLKKSYKVQIN